MALDPLLEEIALPFLLGWRVLSGRLSVRIGWSLMDTWWPFRVARRIRMHYRVWRQLRRRPRGEFDPCLDLDLRSMLEMNTAECERYLQRIMAAREREHSAARPSV